MQRITNFFARLGPFIKATLVRFRAEMPAYFQAISDGAYAIYGLAIALQPDLLELVNLWLKTGLHPLPFLGYLSSLLAGLALGLQVVARLTANLAKLTRRQIQTINPTQPEIAGTIL